MNLKKYAVCLVFWLAGLLLGSIGFTSTGYAATPYLQDYFTTNSNLWNYLGSATRTPDGKIMLTPGSQNQVGTIWLKQAIAPPYTVTFRFQMVGSLFQTEGADGISFMFNKLQNVSPVSGGGMGFEVGNGYGVEFDSYSNPFDPSYNHISLFKNNPDHSLAPALTQTSDTTIENGQWHDVKVNVGTNLLKVYVDNTLKLNWSGTIDNTYNGLGLSASTGYYYNAQYIDDVTITKAAAVTGVSSALANGDYGSGAVIPIQVAFNDAIQVTGTPRLQLNTGRSASYVSGSGTNTLTFSYTVQAGDNVADLGYSSVSALSLNGGQLIDTVGNTAVLTLPALNSAGSLSVNKQIRIDTTAPTSAAPEAIAVTGGNPAASTVSLGLSANDAGGSGLAQMRFSNNNSSWTLWEPYSTAKTYTLPATPGNKTVYVQFMDKAGNTSPSYSVTLKPPTASGIPSAAAVAVTEDTATPILNLFGLISNPGGRALTYIIESSPAKGTISLNTTNGNYTYTPKSNLTGYDSFTFKVSDGIQYSNAASVILQIAGENDPPIASDTTLSVIEDVPTSGTLNGSDTDSTVLAYSILNTPAPNKGTVSITNASTGAYIYTPNADAVGTDSFNFAVADNQGLISNTGTVNITITPVNDAPVATNGTLTINEDTETNGTLTATDPDGNSMSYSLVTNGARGTVNVDANGAYTYTPRANTNGTDSFSFRAYDGSAYSAVATVNITIVPVNDAPSFQVGANQLTSPDTPAQAIEGWASNIMAGPANEAAQSLNFVLSNNNNGLFSIQPEIDFSGKLTYKPASDQTGTADVTVVLMDNGGTADGGSDTSAEQTFTITIGEIPVSFREITLNPNTQWTHDNIEVTASVYSATYSVIDTRWIRGNYTVTDFVYGFGNSFSGNFDVTENGTYTLYAKNTNGDQAATQVTISSIDKTVPVISLRGSAAMTLEAGTVFVDPGADVTDNSLPTGRSIVAATSNLNVNAVGDYSLTYIFSDLAGNDAETVSRSVHVRDTTPPVINLNGANPTIVQIGTAFEDEGAAVTENSNQVGSVTVTGSVNTGTTGTYVLTYYVTDGAGNTATPVSRTVIVQDILPPKISTVTQSPADWTSGNVTVSVVLDGTGSAIQKVRWAAGVHTADYFLSDGELMTGITPLENTVGTFTATENGIYTVYAEDSYGYHTVAIVTVVDIDKTGPVGSVTINNGDNRAFSTIVTLQLNAADTGSGVNQMRLSNFADFRDASWIPYFSSTNWQLSGTDGMTAVYAQFKDILGNESPIVSAEILLDSVTPALDQTYGELAESSILGDNLFINAVTSNLTLPTEGIGGTMISWASSHPAIKSDGTVKRPGYEQGDAHVTLTATLTNGVLSLTKWFAVTVLRTDDPTWVGISRLNLDYGQLSPDFDPEVGSYAVTVSNEAETLNLTPEEVNPSSTLTVIGAVYNNGAIAASLQEGFNYVNILVASDDGLLQKSYTLTIYREPQGLMMSDLYILGGALSAAFDKDQTEYELYADDPEGIIGVLPYQVKNDIALAITGIENWSINEGVFSIRLNGASEFSLEARNASNNEPLKTYHFRVSSRVGLAASNPEGTKVKVLFKEELDKSFALDPSRFTFESGGLSVTDVRYSQGDPYALILSITAASGAFVPETWKLNIQEGARTADGQPMNIKGTRVVTASAVQALRDELDELQDGIHIDDIVSYMIDQTDVTGDRVFDRYDVILLLSQL